MRRSKERFAQSDRHLSWLVALWMIAGSMALTSCDQVTTADSRLAIDSGTYITDTSPNRAPAVVWLGMCTATAVSTDTILFAAHCVGRGSGANGLSRREICIKKTPDNPDNPAAGKCSIKVFAHPGYNGGNFKNDIAVAVFPAGTFANFFPVQTKAPAVGDPILMVGYSDDNPGSNSGDGSKRWGRNKIAKIANNTNIVTEYGRSASAVAVSPGDSGGPLFTECKVTGVASTMLRRGTKLSNHTNVTEPTNTSWLETLGQSEGAHFCGLPGTDPQFCPPAGQGAPNPALLTSSQTDQFPCDPSGSPLPGGASPFAVAIADMDAMVSPRLAVAVPAAAAASQVAMCLTVSTAGCSGTPFALTPLGARGDHALFITPTTLPLGRFPGQPSMVLVWWGGERRLLRLTPR